MASPPEAGPTTDHQQRQPYMIGVLNVTPDSFSDGGRNFDPAIAVQRGLALVADGADWVDVGGESTRPGAERTPGDEERRRVLPVIAAFADSGVKVSIDTMRADVAEAAVRAGALLVNDVSGGRADPQMLATVAELGVPYILTHWRAHSRHMDRHSTYQDLMAEVVTELSEQIDHALAAGVRAAQLRIDPGLGFSKTAAQSWAVLGNLHRISALGYPVVVGASRKRMILDAVVTADRRDGDPREAELDLGTATLSALLALSPAARIHALRVHDVAATATALSIAARLRQALDPAAGSTNQTDEQMRRVRR